MFLKIVIIYTVMRKFEASRDYGFYLKQIIEIFDKKANADLRKYNVTASQMRYIFTVFRYGNIDVPMKVIEKELDVAQSTISGLTSRLLEKGLITVNIDKNNPNGKAVSLTDKTDKILDGGEKFHQYMESLIAKPLTDEEKELFLIILKKVLSNLTDKKELP